MQPDTVCVLKPTFMDLHYVNTLYIQTRKSAITALTGKTITAVSSPPPGPQGFVWPPVEDIFSGQQASESAVVGK